MTWLAMQINYGVLSFLSNNEQGPEKLVVILDCRGATALQVRFAACLVMLAQAAHSLNCVQSSPGTPMQTHA